MVNNYNLSELKTNNDVSVRLGAASAHLRAQSVLTDQHNRPALSNGLKETP